MPSRGHIQNGSVVPEGEFPWPDGTPVVVDAARERPVAHSQDIPTLYERLKEFIGVADDLPADLAENHDHYLHGRPKE
ncbi:MAG: hypothetical protein RBS80_07955 [Thermoguttaceae bacterium]|jgi:hypothetical protein|nr:hypothetical protein [Thermoguttaceae bacterium]